MTINGKGEGITTDDLLSSGQVMGLTMKKCKNIIADVSEVVATFSDIAGLVGIKEHTIDAIEKVIKNYRLL